ncbi:ThiF family adenylyltransferase [Pseudomonas aeruginosa]|uniref:HesA/MoeB/ThiF family protein n=1 Tax=Pseudomonas aeruginosa TaxID=287 RepID=UPI001B35E88F|nr:ThiF family adenylyltransferase [Pseudomonas aeruginosa]MBP8322332.1 ThiF family adenylyltransferase [Pseudomonas aeruginosa]
MNLDLSRIQSFFPAMQLPGTVLAHGVRAFRLTLTGLPPQRGFQWAELRLPRNFPHRGKAQIVLSPDAVLRSPHVDSAGVVCIDEDPGALAGLTAEERILYVLDSFVQKFLLPWSAGALDNDFEDEALNYWSIHVKRKRTSRNPIFSVWTIDSCPSRAAIRNGWLLLPERTVIVADDLTEFPLRVMKSIGVGARQRVGVSIADIPIEVPLTPATWPKSNFDLDMILQGRLSDDDFLDFSSSRSHSGRKKHRIVLFRNAEFGFAYLLGGGPPTIIDYGKKRKTYPSSLTISPLPVSRIDPSWTYGRDQYSEIAHRQQSHVLVFGLGALGSPIIDQLAKAGVGNITIVDPDTLSPANIGRHVLGLDSVGVSKAKALAYRIGQAHPSCNISCAAIEAGDWFQRNSLNDVNLVLDLTGEPEVRQLIDHQRQNKYCAFLVGWMEPYVAAAHACLIPRGVSWYHNGEDPLTKLEAVTWPPEVLRREPGCSSSFQSYTAAAATYAVGIIIEAALRLLDEPNMSTGKVVSWVRGQGYLNKHWPGLKHRDWAVAAAVHDGIIMTRDFND